MCFENISYYDANSKLPKFKKTQEYYQKNEQFPMLRQTNTDKQSNDVITVQQRKKYTPIKRTYAAITQIPEKKSREIPKPGYDREAHNACLINTQYKRQKRPIVNRSQINNYIGETSNQGGLTQSEAMEIALSYEQDPIIQFREILKMINSLDANTKRGHIDAMSKILKANRYSSNGESDDDMSEI